MKSDPRSGAAIVLSVLLLAAITVLVGFGRLAMYRNQVKLRLDRVREIQQEFATRSAVLWLETVPEDDGLPSESVPFVFPTVRGDMGVTLEPAEPVFPRKAVPGDFDISKSGRNSIPFDNYVFASEGVGQPVVYNDGVYLTLADETTSPGVVRSFWADIDKTRANALWTDSDFGLRYLVYVPHFCKQTPDEYSSDLLRFAITPKDAALESSGGTPRSAYAIWVEQEIPKEMKDSGSTATAAELSLWVRAPGLYGDESHLGGKFLAKAKVRADKSKGLQLASTKASLVQQLIANDRPDAIRSTATYAVLDLDEKLGTGFTKKFAEQCNDGIRLTTQIVVRRPRPEDGSSESEGEGTMSGDGKSVLAESFRTSIGKIAVTPAYEYATVLEWRERGGEVAKEVSTVIRCDPSVHGEANDGLPVSTVTYDTHGTYANRKNHLGNLTR